VNGAKKAAKNKVGMFNNLGIILTLAVICVIFTVLSPVFFSAQNLVNILQQVSMMCICAVGMTFIMLTGGIDLSIGAILGFASTTMAWLMVNLHMPMVLAVLVAVAACIGIGIGNGLLITKLKLVPFIVTLGVSSMVRGVIYTWMGGKSIYGFPTEFANIAGNIGGVFPFPIIMMAAVVLVGFYVLRYTKTGRYIYAIGGNENTSHYSGINVGWYKTLVYAVGGLCASVAAMIMVARMNAAVPSAGENYELNSIAAVVIGGTSMSGGEGGLLGTFIGVLIMGVVNNGMNLLNVAQGAQSIVLGAIIVVAVMMDALRQYKSSAA
jgi:ribose transport system permease protein